MNTRLCSNDLNTHVLNDIANTCRLGPDHEGETSTKEFKRYFHIPIGANASNPATLRPAVVTKMERLRKGGEWESDSWQTVEGFFKRLMNLIDRCWAMSPRHRPQASVIHQELESIVADLFAILG